MTAHHGTIKLKSALIKLKMGTLWFLMSGNPMVMSVLKLKVGIVAHNDGTSWNHKIKKCSNQAENGYTMVFDVGEFYGDVRFKFGNWT